MPRISFASRFRLGLGHSGVAAIDVRDGVVHLVRLSGLGRKASRALFRQETIDSSLHPGDRIAATAAAIARAAHGLDLARIPTAIVLPNSSEALSSRRFPRLGKKALASAIEIAASAGTTLEGAAKRSRSFVQSSGVDDAGQRYVEAVLVEATEAAIDEAERVGRAAGVRVARVSSAALALGRALGAAGDAKGTVLVVDLGGPQTVLSTFRDGKFLMSREADVTADLLSDELGAVEDLLPSTSAGDDAAAPLLDAMGIGGGGEARAASDAPGAVAAATAVERTGDGEAALEPTGNVSPQKLRLEIVRSNRYLTSHYRRPIERIYLTGPVRESRALASRLDKGLGVPVAVLDARSAFGAHGVEGHPSSASARCLGAALELLAPARERGYQFLVPRRGLRKHVMRPELAAAAAALVVVAVALAAARGRTARAGARLSALREELRAATAALVIPGAQIDPAQVESRLAVYRMLRDNQPCWSPAVSALAAIVPDDVWLTGVEVEAGDADDLPSMEEILAGIGATHVDAAAAGGDASTRLVVTGRTHDLAAVSRFLEALAASDLLTDARVLSVAIPESEAGAFAAAAAATSAAASTAAASPVGPSADAGAGASRHQRHRVPYEFSLSVAPALHRARAASVPEVTP